MISEVFVQHSWLWPLAWQSTLCLAAGLGGSFLLRRHAVRAHQVLLLGLIAAVLIPAMSQVVQRNQWGLLVAERAVALPERHPFAAQADLAIADQRMTSEPTNARTDRESSSTAPAPPTAKLEWTQAILPVWFAASSILFLRLAIQFLLGWRLAKRSEAIDDLQTLDMVDAARTKFGIRADVRVRTNNHTHSPVIWCWGRRPVLLIPEGPRRGDDCLDWTSIICHELAHAKRHDHVSGLFAELMVCMLPWQLLLWWARQRLAALSEEACDDWVIASGQRATSYARTLLGLTPQGQAALLPGVVTNRRGLAGRVRRILADGCGDPRPGLRWTLAIVAIAGGISLGLAFAQSRPATTNGQAQTDANETAPPAEATAYDPFPDILPDMIRLWLTDPNDRPVAGAAVGVFADTTEETSGELVVRPTTRTSDKRGEVLLRTSQLHARLTFDIDDVDKARGTNWAEAVCIIQRERNLGAICSLTNADGGKSFNVRLQPLCHVRGTLSSPGLPPTMALREVNAMVLWQMIPVYQRSSKEREFDVPLPPGEYTMTFDGRVYWDSPFLHASTLKRISFIIAPGQKHLDLGDIKLRPTKLTTMIGQPAPEIGPMRDWWVGSPVTLASLRGQFVWLHFGGVTTLTGFTLPKLVELHAAFADKGLAMIMILASDPASLEELDERWSNTYPHLEQIGFRGITFPVAVDADAPANREETNRKRIGPTFERYGIAGYPTDIVIDPAGKIIGECPISKGTDLLRTMLDRQAQTTENKTPPLAETTSDSPFDSIIPDGMVRFRLTDPNGRPVAGATVGAYVQTRAKMHQREMVIVPAQKSDERGEVIFDISGISTRKIVSPAEAEEIRTKNLPRGAVYVLQMARDLGAIQELRDADTGKSFDVCLQPVCLVRGTVSSPDLPATVSLREIYAEVQWQKIRVLQHSSQTREIAFPLPPGEYTVTFNGSAYENDPRTHVSTTAQVLPLKIAAGQRHLDLGDIKLRPTKLATMIGQPAPELGPIQAWKNGPPVTMAQLRGRVVILYFGGDHPILPDISALAKLQDTFSNEGLTILAIYNCASVEEVEQRWPRYDPKYGQMENVPFRIAVDGGEPTINEATGETRLGVTYGRYDIFGSVSVLIDQAGKIVGEYPNGEGADIIRRLLDRRERTGFGATSRGRFDEVYRLEEDQILKRIAPPFLPERMDYYRNQLGSQAKEIGKAISRGPDQIVLRWDGKLKMRGLSVGDVNPLNRILCNVLGFKRYEYDGSKSLLNLELAGDWIIRDEAPQEMKLRALEELVAREFGRKIRFEKRTLERETIIAKGGFRFHPPAAAEEDTAVHLYATETGPDERAIVGTAQSISEFLQMLGNLVNMPALNRTGQNGPIHIPYIQHRSSIMIQEVQDEHEKVRQVTTLLDHATAQTELQFEVRKEPVEVWFVTESTSP